MTDDEIIRRLEARQESALTALSEKYGSYCRQIALRMTQQVEDAEEIVNDTWLRVWQSIPPQKPDNLRHYLIRLTRNLSLDRLKKQQAEKRGGSELPLVLEELENCLPAADTPETELNAKELGAAVNRFLDGLPVRTQDIFLRRYFFSESVPEIAARFRMREDNVRLTLSRTRAKLKRYLTEGEYL